MFEEIAHDLRRLLKEAEGRSPEPSAANFDGRTVQSTPESGERAGYDGFKKKNGSETHVAVDTVGHLLAGVVTPANEQERAQVEELSRKVQEATDGSVRIAFTDQGYTGDVAAQAAREHGIELEVVKLPEREEGKGAKKGFVLLPRRWVVERSLAWAGRFRRLARDYERLPETVAALHFVVFAILQLLRASPLLSLLQSS